MVCERVPAASYFSGSGQANEMAGLKGKSGPPGNMNAFKRGLAAIQKRREESVTSEREESGRQQILDGVDSR